MAAKDKADFHHESLEDGKTVSTYLRAVCDGFAEGTLRLSDRDGAIVLQPDGLVTFEVSASQRRGRATFTLSFSWREKTAKDDGKGGPLKINGELDDADEGDRPDADS